MADETILKIKGLSKSFDSVSVFEKLDFEVKKGEFITILGASGCGKTTLLRAIAGLVPCEEGEIYIDNKEISKLPPNRRGVSMVFQNYALFPHMNVADNIAYSLKLRGESKEERRTAVERALALVALEGYEKRMPTELSGGQRQRVAIARALVSRPQVMLLDEPLGALDLQLRRQMQVELKRLQKQLGITFLYITHDQEEALNMSDMIAVMRAGKFEQFGTPAEIYNRPATDYVARFVGNANLIPCTIIGVDGDEFIVSHQGVTLRARRDNCPKQAGATTTLSLRSEYVEFCTEGIQAQVVQNNFIGGMLYITLRTSDGQEIVASRLGLDVGMEIGSEVHINWNAHNAGPVNCTGGLDET